MEFKAKKVISVSLISLLLAISFVTYFSTNANAAGFISSASIQMSDPRPSQTPVTFTVVFTPTATTVKCFDIIISDTSGHIVLTTNPATTIPTGFSSTGAAKGSVTGATLTDGNWTGFFGTNGVIQYQYATGAAPTAAPVTIVTTGITNTSSSTYYAQIATYNTLVTNTCSGLVDSSNVMALVTTGGVATSVTVDPTLTFTVAGTSGVVNGAPSANAITDAARIPFGSVPADGATATQAAQLLTTSTNAVHGYSIYIRNTQLLTDANSDTIRAQGNAIGSPASFDASTSQSSFAFTTNSTTVVLGSNLWAGLTTTNVAIDTQTSAQNANAIKVAYQLRLSNVQPPGTYSNVITYTATPVY